MQECESLVATFAKKVEGSKGKVWEVFVSLGKRFRNKCSCPAFYFHGKGKSCKHIDKVLSEICTWHEQSGIRQTEQQKEKYICPDCNGQTVYVRVGI